MDYYKKNGVNCIEIIDDVLNFWGYESEAFYLGNVIKYVMRAPYKEDYNGDIDKAIDYLQKLKRVGPSYEK